jgi:ketosteroid isomerase-like protein
MIEENEKLVRAFYEATVPGHRASLRGIQSPHVVYDLPKGMPFGCGHFEGLDDVLERFLTSFYGALDVRFIAEEFIAAGDNVVAIGRIEGTTRKAGIHVNVPFAHVWTCREGFLQRLRAFTDTALLAEAVAKG